MQIKNRRFVAYIHIIPPNISLGVTIDPMSPNIEIHLPFCFIKIGWAGIHYNCYYKTYGKQ